MPCEGWVGEVSVEVRDGGWFGNLINVHMITVLLGSSLYIVHVNK